MKLKFYSFILLFMAVLFVGNSNAIDAQEDPDIQIEQVIDTNTLDAVAVDIQSEVATYLECQYSESLHIVTTAGDNDHYVIIKQLSWYQSYFKPPNYPLAKGQGFLKSLKV